MIGTSIDLWNKINGENQSIKSWYSIPIDDQYL